HKKISLFEPFISQKQLLILFIVAIIAMLIGMGYPFRLYMGWLLDYLKVIKNFRAICRTLWVSYWIFGIIAFIFAAYYIRLFINNNIKFKKYLGYVLILILPVLFILEAIPYAQNVSKNIIKSKNEFIPTLLSSDLNKVLQSINSSQYQALLPLPFAYRGSEYGKYADDRSLSDATILSVHTGLPIIGASLTRISIPESRNIFQLFSPVFIKKDIEADLPNKKDFIIIHNKLDQLTIYEKDLLTRAIVLKSTDNHTIFRLPYDSAFLYAPQRVISEFYNKKDSLYFNNDFFVTAPTKNVFYNSFDSLFSEVPFSGKGGIRALKKEYTCFNRLLPHQIDTGTYTASIHVYNCGKNFGQATLSFGFFAQIVKQDNSIEWLKIITPSESPLIDGCWSLAEITFTLPKNFKELVFCFKGDDYSKFVIYADEFLLRPHNVDVFKEVTLNNKKYLFYNNHFLTME
ncbi:MAG: hypothetical protein SNJ71_05755, partial [Bacteroidales bacterium]